MKLLDVALIPVFPKIELASLTDLENKFFVELIFCSVSDCESHAPPVYLNTADPSKILKNKFKYPENGCSKHAHSGIERECLAVMCSAFLFLKLKI